MKEQPRKRNYAIINRARAIYQRTKPNCYICGKPIDYTATKGQPLSLVVEHKVAFSRGGADHPDNYGPAHWECNSKKRARDYAPIIRRSGGLK